LRALDEEYAHFQGELAQAFSNVPSEEGMAVIDEAVRAARGSG